MQPKFCWCWKMFNPVDFLDIAQKLEKNSEARIRTSVGRAYYASFLTARNALAINEKTPQVHRKVLDMLYSKNPVIANKLHYLRRLRNLADYDTELAMGVKDAEKAVGFAEEIIIKVSDMKGLV
jgi:uncharacterized protein (UPF0332 family)